MTTSEMATVLAWHDALNASNLATLVALCSDDIEIGDAHGAGQGHQALRKWAAGITTTTEVGRIFVHDGVVVVEQKISGSDTSGADATVASAFRVVHDHITSVFRHESLESALAATDLTEADLVE